MGKQCSARIYHAGGSFGGAPCKKPVTVTVGERNYCAIHDPVRVAARGTALRAKWDAKASARRADNEARAEREARRDHAEACFDEMLALLEDLFEHGYTTGDDHDRVRNMIAKAKGEAK